MQQIELSKVYDKSENINIGRSAITSYLLKFRSDAPLYLGMALERNINHATNNWDIIITLTHDPKLNGHHYGRIGNDILTFECDHEFEAKKVFETFSKLFKQHFSKKFYLAFDEGHLGIILNMAWNAVQLDLEI